MAEINGDYGILSGLSVRDRTFKVPVEESLFQVNVFLLSQEFVREAEYATVLHYDSSPLPIQFTVTHDLFDFICKVLGVYLLLQVIGISLIYNVVHESSVTLVSWLLVEFSRIIEPQLFDV